jgi:hypothetical protein
MDDEERLLRFAINLVIFSMFLLIVNKIINMRKEEKCASDRAAEISKESCVDDLTKGHR